MAGIEHGGFTRGFRFRTLPAGTVLLTALLAAWPLQAHLVTTDPEARSNSRELTEDPCGGVPAGPVVANYTAGTDVEITVNLVVEHVDFLQAVISHDNFANRSVLATVPTDGRGTYRINVTLPEQPLGPATLQATDGTYVSCADITLSEGEVFAINAGINDAWYDPETDGQGFVITVFPDIGALFLAWFTYDVVRPPDDVEAILGEPGHRWLTAQGPIYGDRALLDVVLTSGGVFDSAEPEAVNSEPGSVGSMEVIFESCSNGVVKYDLPDLGLEGEIPIQRIVGENAALCEALKAR